MTGLNHYLVGVASAVVLKNPLIVLPIAFASHFAMDALPHFGLKFSDGRGRVLMRVTAIDTAILAVAIIFTLQNYPVWYMLAGLFAMSPDAAWVYRFSISEKFGKLPPQPANRFNTWHESIQKFESKWGMLVEVCVAATLLSYLF